MPVELDPAGVSHETLSFQRHVPRHHYSLGVVQLFLKAILSCSATQRAAAAFLELVAAWLPGVAATPCANTGRMWLLRLGLLRLGLHELTRPKEQAGDWVWIMDHTIQLGSWKCLVIVGVRLSAWMNNRRPLCHEDLTLLNLTPMEQATGERVHQALQNTVLATGIPRQIVSDGGTDLKRGVELLHATHPAVAHTHDIKHKTALLLKKELEHNPRWGEFVSHSTRTKLGVVQTSLACLMPATLKVKARYMNLDALVAWGHNLLQFLERPRPIPGVEVERTRLEAKFGWVRQYRRELQDWSELLAVADTAEDYVRQEGYHRAAESELRKRLAPLRKSVGGRRMGLALLEFVSRESTAAKTAHERLIGSSEVLESLIGKYKQLQGTHSKGGMTAMLLSLGAIVGNKIHETISTALESIRSDQVGEWCVRRLGMTLQAQRRIAFGGNKTGTQNDASGR